MSLKAEILEKIESNPGISTTEIVEEFKIPRATARGRLSQLKASKAIKPQGEAYSRTWVVN